MKEPVCSGPSPSRFSEGGVLGVDEGAAVELRGVGVWWSLSGAGMGTGGEALCAPGLTAKAGAFGTWPQPIKSVMITGIADRILGY